MGITRGAISLLFELKQSLDLKGSACQLGRQDILATQVQLHNIASRFGFDIGKGDVAGVLNDGRLFNSLGYDTIESIDYSDFEGATHILDLNNPVPDSLHGRYDLIFDGGTLEHIFDLPACLRNIHAMLRTDGLIVHASPSNNFVDHGFYMFSPTLFHDYYSTNKYDILRAYLFEFEAANPDMPWSIYNYAPESIHHLSVGGWGGRSLGVWFVARKRETSSCGVVPQQGYYLRTWTGRADSTAPRRQGAIGAIESVVRSNKLLYLCARAIWRFFARLRSMLFSNKPPVIARY